MRTSYTDVSIYAIGTTCESRGSQHNCLETEDPALLLDCRHHQEPTPLPLLQRQQSHQCHVSPDCRHCQEPGPVPPHHHHHLSHFDVQPASGNLCIVTASMKTRGEAVG
ncbi:unnamed protein product [Ixodes pacificus]